MAGREIADRGLAPHDAIAAWTAGREWIDQQWLAQLGGYGLYRAGGLAALTVAAAAAATAAVALAVVGARRSGASARSTGLVALGSAPALLPFAAVRPQTLAYPLFVAVFVLLERAGSRPTRRVLAALPLLVLWANLHGSALLGAGLVTLWALAAGLGERSDAARLRLAAVAAASWACLLATPHGWSIARYYGKVFGNAAFGEVVSEWMAPSFPGQLPFFALCAAALLVVLGPWPRYSLFARAAVAATAAAGLQAVRHTVWLPLLLVVLAPRALDALRAPRAEPRHLRVNAVLVGGVAALVAALAAVAAARPESFYERPFEQAAARAVAEAALRSEAPLFADPHFADWLLWRRPELRGRVAFDARFELLSDRELRRLGAFFRREGPDWREAASCCSVLVLQSGRRATTALARDPHFRTAYRDATVTVLVRAGSAELAS